MVRREKERPAALSIGEATATAQPVADSEISFFIRGPQPHGTLEGWGDIVKSLEDHPSRVFDEKTARFVLVAMPEQQVARLGDLPLRSADRPYIAWGWDRSDTPDKDELYLKKRGNGDILFVGYDLRPFGKDTGRLVRGITLPPPLLLGCMPMWSIVNCEPKKPNDPKIPPKFFLTYRGDKKPGLFYTSSVRPDLANAFKDFNKDNVVVEFSEKGGDPGAYAAFFRQSGNTYLSLFNSAFVLVPRGHGRWTYRFSEVIGACSIPVIMADGLTMPFEELIDWSKASITLPESLAKEGAQAIIDRLPKDPEKIEEMRTEVCRINAKYFASMKIRTDTMLHAASIKARQTGQQ
jgi:hypothetical protein